MNYRCLTISILTIGSCLDNTYDKYEHSKYFILLNKMSMKSQNGKIPVPPQTMTTNPF
jgi:hypothetical protein